MSPQERQDKPRRSAGMRQHGGAEQAPISATPPSLHGEDAAPGRMSASRYPRPKVLMGEVAGPVQKSAGPEIARKRGALRAFMRDHRLTPSGWAKAAHIAPGEILAFLTGRSIAIAPECMEKLARAAGCAPEDLFEISDQT